MASGTSAPHLRPDHETVRPLPRTNWYSHRFSVVLRYTRMLVQQPDVSGTPAPPPPPAIPSVIGPGLAPRMLEAAQAQRSELRDQLDRLQNQREEIVDEMQSDQTPEAAMSGLEARLANVDARINAVDEQLAQADANVASTAAIPGAVVSPPRIVNDGPAEGLIAIPIVFTMFVLFPIALAYSRRIWKRAATVIAPVPQEVRDKLDQMGDMVETMALEVERIGEGQRFITKVLTDNNPRSLGEGAMQSIPVPRAADPVEARPGESANWR